MATIIGDAIIRIVVDPSAAVAAVDGQKGNEKARPAEKSEKPAKRSDGEGSETNTPDVGAPEEVTNRATKEDEQAFREQQKTEARDARAQKKRSAFIDRENKKADKTKERAALRAKGARQAVAGRATRRVLNRTVPVIGRAGTIGKQTSQTLASLVGVRAAGPAGIAAGAAAGAITAGAKFGHQATQFTAGLLGDTAADLISQMAGTVALGALGPQGLILAAAGGTDGPFAIPRWVWDVHKATMAGISAGKAALGTALGTAAIAGIDLSADDVDRERALALNAARNAYERSRREIGLERTLEGWSARSGGKALQKVISRPFQNARTQR